jgi:hypothetical protein
VIEIIFVNTSQQSTSRFLLFEHSDLSPLFAYELPQKVAAKKKWCQRPGKINAVEMADINNKWHRQMDEYKPHDRELFVSCS